MEDSLRNNFKREFEALATIRDELRLKAHLARKDVQDELSQLEVKYRLVDEELGRAKQHAQAGASRIGQDVKSLLVDLKQGYEAVRRRLGS
ncbi:MAG TPA: hypothetical protein VMF89_30040 [Polyangiales bacterium]|nr:hypothetical protein [Polyangiales bacterium]